MLETQEATYSNIRRRVDGSYQIDKAGMPCHIPNEQSFLNEGKTPEEATKAYAEWAEQWEQINAYALEHPDEVTEETPLPAPTLEELKTRKKNEIAAARYEAETSGVTVEGAVIDTDRESQSLITGAALAATLDESYSLNWKTADGFISLTAPQIIAVAQAVRAHVQSCFDREAALNEQIDAANSKEELEAIAW